MANVFRTVKDKNYSVISNEYLRDKNLRLESIGLMTIILSLSSDYKITMDSLLKLTKENYRTIKFILKELKENGKVDVAISELVKKGLPSSLQKAMDIVRVIGNEAVHPGEINIDDNIEIAYALFRLINIIVEKMIVEPNVINDLYQLLPEAKLKGIEIRDKKNDEKK